jgi:signal transduction histidine kinase
VAWNPAAEVLTGWTVDEVLGRRPPHLPAEQLDHLAEAFDEAVEGPFPALVARRHRNGHLINVLVERQVLLRDPDGKLIGWGRFFRAATDEEELLHRRSALSRELAEVRRFREVRELLGDAIHDLLGADFGAVLRPCDTFAHVHGLLALRGEQDTVEGLAIPLDGTIPAARQAGLDRTLATGELPLGSGAATAPAWFIPMGPAASGWILALTFAEGLPADATTMDLAKGIAAETWGALQRAELIRDLEDKIEILEASRAISATAGLDLDQALETVCREAATALSCERAGVYLLEPDGVPLLAYLLATDRPDVPDGGVRTAGESLQNGMFVVQDATQGEFLDGPWHPDAGAVSVLGLPLQVGERALGALVVAHTQAGPRGFTSLCQQVADALATQAALTIENARLFASARENVARLEELDRLKQDYVDGLSHDLRSPLTALLGFVSTLRRTEDSASAVERREYLEVIERQARRIAGMVDDLLTSAKLDAGALKLERLRPVPLAAVVEAALETVPPSGRARVSIAADPDAVALGDRSQLVRVAQNLIENALKYSREPSAIKVVCTQAGSTVHLTVQDEGRGIDQTTRERLFSRFGRGTAASGPGTGLGLYITRGIVEAHRGDISVESTPGVGSTFTVRLPAGGPAQGPG